MNKKQDKTRKVKDGRGKKKKVKKQEKKEELFTVTDEDETRRSPPRVKLVSVFCWGHSVFEGDTGVYLMCIYHNHNEY